MILRILCLLVLLGLFLPKQAFAFHAEMIPSRISPGDPFILKICGQKPIFVPKASLNGAPLGFNQCGDSCFFALGAVPLETAPGIHSFSVHVGTDSREIILTVQPTRFPTMQLTLPDHQVFLSPEDEERADAERKLLEVLWQRKSERQWSGNFIEPLDNGVGTEFGTTRIMNKEKRSIHRGMDFKGEHGEKVRASNSGTVALAKELFFGGKTIVLDHGQGIYSVYMHLSEYSVKVRDRVAKGESLGSVGSSGRASGPHLHFGIKLLEMDVNPLSLFRLPL